MIFGIVAGQSSRNVDASPYPNSLAVMDFITGDYWIGQTRVGPGDVIDQPSFIGAAGLQIVDTQPNPTHIIGQFLALLISMNWTMVLEWADVFAGSQSLPIWIADTSTAAIEQTFLESNETSIDVYDQPIPGTDRQVTKTGLAAMPGTRRAAITRVNSKLAVSVNGGAVTSDTAGTGAVTGYDAASFGGRPDSSAIQLDVNIRRLILYAPQADALLPSLSAI